MTTKTLWECSVLSAAQRADHCAFERSRIFRGNRQRFPIQLQCCLAIAHHQAGIALAGKRGDIVQSCDQREAARDFGPQDLLQIERGDRVQPVEGLIQNYDCVTFRKCCRNGDPLTHPSRARPDAQVQHDLYAQCLAKIAEISRGAQRGEV